MTGRVVSSDGARADRMVEAFRFDDDRGQPCLRASPVEFALPAEHFQAECFLLFRFSATASRMRLFSECSLILSFSSMSMARLTLPSRLELNRPEGSFKAAPLKNVSLTALL